jgi:hypothetical protein
MLCILLVEYCKIADKFDMWYIFAFNMCSFEFQNKSSWGRVQSNTHGSDVLRQGEPAGWLWCVKGNSSSITVKRRCIQVSWDLHYLVSTCMNIRFQYTWLNATAMFYVLSAPYKMTRLMFMTPEQFCLYLLFIRKAKHRHLLVIVMLFSPDESSLQLQIS